MSRHHRLRRIGDPSVMAAVAVLVLALYGVTKSINDPDFWWHLRAGQLLLSTHHLLGTDPFTYTVSAHHWTMHEWLTEVIYAALFSAGGLGLIVLLISVISWGGILCLAATARLDRPHNLILAIGIVLALVTGYPVWAPRPQMFDFAGSCLVLLLAERHLRSGGRSIWWLLPIFLIWSNLHSGFVIGIAWLLLIGVAEGVGSLMGWRSDVPVSRIRTLFLVAVAALAVAVINPNGPAIILYPFGTVGSAEQERLIQEWSSPSFHEMIIRVGFAPMLASLVLMVIINRRLRPREAALFAVSTALALQSERNIALFVAASTPVWITQANLLFNRLWTRRSALGATAPPGFMQLASLAVLILLAALDGAGLIRNSTLSVDAAAYTANQPVCAARWLAAAPQPLRIFNQYGEGGYLSFTLSSAGNRVYIFGDAALMGDQQLINYGDITFLNPNWDNLLEISGTQVVLFDNGASLSNVLNKSPRWHQVYTDSRNTIWVRTGSPLLQTLRMPANANGARSGICRRTTGVGK